MITAEYFDLLVCFIMIFQDWKHTQSGYFFCKANRAVLRNVKVCLIGWGNQDKTGGGELTDTKALQLKFWESFRTFLIERESSVRPQQASAQHWMNFGIGKSGFLLSAISNSRDNRIGVSLDIMKDEDKIIFNSLYSDQIEIERKIGESLEWRESPGKKTSRILLHQNRLTLDQADWSDQQLWLAEKLELFKEVFGPLIKPPKPWTNWSVWTWSGR